MSRLQRPSSDSSHLRWGPGIGIRAPQMILMSSQQWEPLRWQLPNKHRTKPKVRTMTHRTYMINLSSLSLVPCSPHSRQRSLFDILKHANQIPMSGSLPFLEPLLECSSPRHLPVLLPFSIQISAQMSSPQRSPPWTLQLKYQPSPLCPLTRLIFAS